MKNENPLLISSSANPKIKEFLRLRNPKVRKVQNAFMVEGEKELSRAAKNGFVFQRLFYCAEIITREKLNALIGEKNIPREIYRVSPKIFAKMVYRDTSGGVVAVVKRKLNRLENLKLTDNPCILVIENVEKPGNLGAIFRTADAAGIDAIIFCDAKTDIYNPNVIRASIGCIFSVPFAVVATQETIEWLNQKKIRIYCTSLSASVPFYKADYTIPSALVIGTEAVGLSKEWLQNSQQNILIPMFGQIDSLNASVSAALVLYEILRQRKFICEH